ncbi:MAG: hypothetical protein KTR16_11575 [Acidiferrobacterales bacterium]|nr:hypothetical protein [Acidiferrobacterales bacterium]
MADNVGGIEYTIEANVDPLLRANKQADSSLDSMEKSFDKAADGSKKFDSRLTVLAASVKKVVAPLKATSVAALAVGAAMTAIALKASSVAKEIENMARLSGVSVETFQELAFGARGAGISAEKLGDIFKDVQDKVGDFINTGGGELKDYFENIAPLVNQTAEEFADLSGPDALIKFKEGLDAANLSASEQIFYLESLANDAALLGPLLADNAQGFKDSAERARELNLVLSETEIAELSKVKNEFDALFSTVGTVTSKIVADFAPSIISALEAITGFVAKAGIAVEDFLDLFQDADNVDNIETLEERLKDLIKTRDDLRDGIGSGVGRSANNARERIQELNAEIQATVARINELNTTAIEINTGQDDGALVPDKNAPISIFDTEQGKLDGGGDDSVSSMNVALQDGLGISAQMAAEIEVLDAKFQDLGTTINDTLVGSALTFGDTIGNAFASAIASGDSLNDTFKNIAGTIAQQVLAQLISVGVQYGINAALKTSADATIAAGSVASITATTAAGVASATTLANAYAPAAAAAAVATSGGAAAAGTAGLVTAYSTSNALSLAGGRLNGGAVSPNSAYQVTENGQPEMLTVGGKNILMTGSQGGTVTSNKDLVSSGSGGTVVNVYNQSSNSEATTTSTTQDGKEVISIVVADINNRGKIHSAITKTTTANNKT